MLKVAINGFGRIGRNFLRASLGSKSFRVVARSKMIPPLHHSALVDKPKYDHLRKITDPT